LEHWRAAPDAHRVAVERFAAQLRARTWDDMAAGIQRVIEPHSGMSREARDLLNQLDPSTSHDR